MFKFGYELIYLALCLTPLAFASQSDFDRAFQQGINAGAAHKQQAQNSLQQLNPGDIFKNYTPTPEQSHYYSGVTQTSSSIEQDAINQSTHNETVKVIQNVAVNQQQIDKEALQLEINRVSQIQDHAYDIVKGISDDFVDCTKQQSCTTTYDDKQCEETPEKSIQLCKRKLNIDMIPHQVDTHFYLNAHLSVKEHKYAGVSLNVVDGSIGFLGPHDASFRLDGRVPADVDCKTLQSSITSQSGASNLDSINLPSCANGLTLDFHISGGHQKDITIDVVSSKISYEPRDRWEDTCLGLANSKICTFQSEQCVQPSSTKIIQTIPVTRACWEQERGYLCGGSEGESSCAPLRKLGCEQISSVCEERVDSGCVKYARSYRCPTKDCHNTDIICNGTSYCLEGDCVSQQKQADADFQKAVSALSASMDAAKQFDQHFIFAGKPKACRNLMLGAAYCCADDGWLIDSHLLSCNQEEKELGDAKEKELSHYIGRYKEDCVGDVCLKKIKSYCTFPTKLARIVQEQGREIQLGRHFGTGKHPDCSGLTVEELQKIDFSRIDFKAVYDDIARKQTVEDQQTLNQRILDEMKKYIETGKSHHD